MSTDGLAKTRSSSAKKSTARSKSQAVVEPIAPPRRNKHDMLGILILGIALVVTITLFVGQGGLVGDSLTGFFRTLFGQAAWAVPVVMTVAGVCLLLGRAPFQVARVAWGSSLLLLGVLGAFAKDQGGDFFAIEAMKASGGAVGAVVGWAFHVLLGAARGVGHAVMILIGFVMCLERPIHEWAADLQLFRRERGPVAEDVDVEPIAPEQWLAERRRTTAERAIEPEPSSPGMPARALQDDDDDELPIPVSRVLKPKAVIRNEVDQRPTPKIELDTEAGEPSEGYKLPPTSLLSEIQNKSKRDPREIQRNIEILEDTLEQFNIEANVVEVATGPTITRYEVQLGPGIKVSRITNLADNIAMSLAASHVRVEAPIPGKSAIGVEVPTGQRVTVTLRELVESLEFHDESSKLTIALGRDVSGVAKYTDLTRMPHMLIGGATNSGKSICMVTIIMSLIMRMSPKDLRLVMIDPKRVELTLFEGLPHLMCPVVKDVKEAAGVLRAVVREMDRRYDKFSEAAVRNIEGWNAKANFQDRLPFIVVIVDELADLMIQCGNEVETSICRLAQLARATGIHLVIATQRPSVDVITGTIKNNISSRIAFAVSSQIDSRTILDTPGAEKLIGKGDMLFLPIDQNKPQRVQGCYVSEKEIEQVCDFWRAQEKPHYVLNPIQIAIEEREGEMRDQQASDDKWIEACRFVVERGEASTSMLQRKFSLGFQRASRLLDMMQERGIVGPRDGSRPREVLVDAVRLEQLLGNSEYMTPMDPDEWIGD